MNQTYDTVSKVEKDMQELKAEFYEVKKRAERGIT